MDNIQNMSKKSKVRKIVTVAVVMLAVLAVLSSSVVAWFALEQRELASYVPVASPQQLSIGAGHVEINNDGIIEDYEDVQYFYLSGIDVSSNDDYYEFVFSVYGKNTPHFRIQLGYTTNNQFSYSIYSASESTVESSSAILHTTHGANSTDYYYSRNGDAVVGTYLNLVVNSESLASSSGTYHDVTYGSSAVNKYAEPVYWRSSIINTNVQKGVFKTYFILRVDKNGKTINDKETDIICIAVKAVQEEERET